MMFRRRGVINGQSHQMRSLSVVAHGAASSPDIMGGRLIPVVAVDATSRPDIEEHITLHRGSGPFDVKSTWAEVPGEGRVCLVLEFAGPTANVAIIKFNMSGQLKAVDRIIQQQAMYLMCGKIGDKVGDLYGHKPSMIVEVKGSWPLKSWNKFLEKALSREGQRIGLNRKYAKIAALREIDNWRAQSSVFPRSSLNAIEN